MSKKIITSEVFIAYTQCPLKAFLLLFSDEQGVFHDSSELGAGVARPNSVTLFQHVIDDAAGNRHPSRLIEPLSMRGHSRCELSGSWIRNQHAASISSDGVQRCVENPLQELLDRQ